MRELVLDDMLPRELAAELRARGRAAQTLAEIGLEHASDAEVLALDGVLVTTVELKGAAVVRGNVRDAVHRHAHVIASQRHGSTRRYIA